MIFSWLFISSLHLQCTAGSKLCSSSAASVEAHDHCESYAHKLKACQDDPECVFCNKGRTDGGPRTGTCLHRSRAKLCVEQNYHDYRDRCPGICPALRTCGTCVTHGQTMKMGVNQDEGKSTDINDLINLSTDRNIYINDSGEDIGTTESILHKGSVLPINMDSSEGPVYTQRNKWRTYNQECFWCVKEAQCQTAA
ncbi:hypothetical protein PoB_002809300, partial [Plakobranchus ocellatus]